MTSETTLLALSHLVRRPPTLDTVEKRSDAMAQAKSVVLVILNIHKYRPPGN